MFKVFGRIAVIAAMLLLFGCATAGVNSLGVVQLPDGSTVNYQASMAPQPWGIDGATIDRYQTKSVFNEHTRKYEPQTVLIAKDAGFTDGLGKQVAVAFTKGATEAGGMMGAGALIRPSTTNVGNGQNIGNGMTNVNQQAQMQSQRQNQRLNNRNTNVNTNRNTNTNINSNHNTAQGGTGGGGGNATAIATNTNTNTATGGSVNTGGGGIIGGGNITAGNNANINTGAIDNPGSGTVSQGQH